MFIGSETGLEKEIVLKAGYEYAGIPAAPLKRSPAALLKAVASVGLGVFQAVQALRRFRPDVVVVTGGYAGIAAGLAAGVLRIPLVLEEANAVPGRATKLLMPYARLIATGIEPEEGAFPAGKTVCTGFPVRPEITQGSKAAALERWNLRPDRPLVMVYGGSQGARTLNRATLAALPVWMEAGIQVLHSAGRKLYDETVPGTEPWRAQGYRPVPYLEGMADAYAAADLVVCRGGASSISEVTACGLPTIIVPYPHHADRHQYKNAEAVERAGAGLMLEDAEAVDRLGGMVHSLIEDNERRCRMAEASRNLGKPDAARRVAEEILKIVKG